MYGFPWWWFSRKLRLYKTWIYILPEYKKPIDVCVAEYYFLYFFIIRVYVFLRNWPWGMYLLGLYHPRSPKRHHTERWDRVCMDAFIGIIGRLEPPYQWLGVGEVKFLVSQESVHIICHPPAVSELWCCDASSYCIDGAWLTWVSSITTVCA